MLSVSEILNKNTERWTEFRKPYNPITGEGCDACRRLPFHCSDLYDGEITIPWDCFNETIIRNIDKCGSIREYIKRLGLRYTKENFELCKQEFTIARWKHDLEFWFADAVKIKDRKSPKDVPFILNRGQRKLLKSFYEDDKAGKPVRIILVKGRQFGGSTMIQLAMAHKQMVQIGQWHSVIVAHVENTAKVIRGMYTKMLQNYPQWVFGEDADLKLSRFEDSTKTRIIKAIGCRLTIGSAEKPNGIVGDNISMAHFSEVGLYKKTEGRTPEELIQSIVSGIAYMPNTWVFYESTARGVGNFFYRETERARNGESAYKVVFVGFQDFDDNSMTIFKNRIKGFAESLNEYERMLFDMGATLEHINWRRHKVKEYADEWRFKSEFPAFLEEAFQATGHRFYPMADILRMKQCVRKPDFVGDIYGKADYGPEAKKDVKFLEDERGPLKIWKKPESEVFSDRYVTVVDIGGTSEAADRSVICVIDRKDMATGGVPMVVAEWCGHTEHYLLAWKAVQMATAYQNSLLVIESNTLETEQTEGDNFDYILDEIAYHYDNLYCRTPADKIREGLPPRWGFHTNKSTKRIVCNHHKKALHENMYIEPCAECITEFEQFEEKPNGVLGAVDGAHDDRNITRAIGIWICYQVLSTPRLMKNANKHSEHRYSRTKTLSTI